jgi:hypothetical protein
MAMARVAVGSYRLTIVNVMLRPVARPLVLVAVIASV